MTLNEIIQRLEEYRDEFGGDCEVRLMLQKNWPFEYSVTGLVSRSEINTDSVTPGGGDCVDQEEAVYIVEGTQLKYGSKKAWAVAD